MSKLVKPDGASHWYQKDGSPCHKVEIKSKPGEYRNTNLADARKFHLLPSVTNVIRLLAKDGLVAWKIEQPLIAVLSMTDAEKKGLTIDQIAEKAVKMSGEELEIARKFGQGLHGAIEDFVCSSAMPKNPELIPYFDHFASWWDKEIVEVYLSERTVVGSSYAGRLDLKALTRNHGVALIDFKTRKRGKPTTKAEKASGLGKFARYDEDIIQLAAYKMADENKFDIVDPMMMDDPTPPIDSVVSLLIDSRTPTPVECHVWKPEEVKRGEDAFLLLLQLWKVLKKYDPAAL